MSKETRPEISEITEDNDSLRNTPFWSFIAASIWAALLGTLTVCVAVYVTADLPLGLADFASEVLLVLGLFALLFALVGMIVIGLPATLILKTIRYERRSAYCLIGILSGAAIMALILEVWLEHSPLVLTLPMAGAIAGGAGGYRWGNCRLTRSAASATNVGKASDPNPIHELIY